MTNTPSLQLTMDATTFLDLVVRGASQNKTTARKPCTVDTCDIKYAIVSYQPTFAGNTIYGVCFMILFLVQLYFGLRKKTWTYMSAVLLGIFGEIVGYVGRLMLSSNPFDMNNFLVLVAKRSDT